MKCANLIALLGLVAAPTAFAQSSAGMMLTPWGEGQRIDTRTTAFYTPSEAQVTGFDVDLTIFDATGRIRLRPEASDKPTIGYEYTRYDIGSGDAVLPDHLADVSVGFGGSFGDVDLGETLGGAWQMGYTVGVGYSGTTPFEEGEAWYGKADLYAIKPIDRDTRWLVGLNYDGNRVFMPDVPLPAVTYFSRLNETTTYGLGLPFSSLTWKPDGKWTIDMRSTLFFSFNGSVRYQATDDLEFFAAYVRRADAFYIANGVDNRRLLFSQQRAELGLNYKVCANAALTVAGGLAFGQEFDVGFDTRDPAGLRDLEDSGYIRIGLDLSY